MNVAFVSVGFHSLFLVQQPKATETQTELMGCELGLGTVLSRGNAVIPLCSLIFWEL